ncbi:MAG: hypothetical protein KAJ62_12960 [Desulfobacteraceae bacterium]|nr:hypothetical protein [Desulfobacteraceae bacterium]
MKKMLNRIFILLLVILALIFSTACVSKKAPKQSIQSSISSSYYALGYSEFESEIALKEEILFAEDVQMPSDEAQAELLIQLVILYSHKKNPAPDFVMALKYLKQYALIKNQISVEYAEALLDIMVENNLGYDILNNKYDKAVKEKKKLEKSRSKLAAKIDAKDKILQENQRIIQKNLDEIKKKNEIIEKLKALDIKLENRRADTD